jgi:competence protein ComEA
MTRRLLPLMAVVIVVAAVASAGSSGASAKGVVNVNTATASQLQLLPRIGPAMAERIVEFRETNGPFRKVDELLAVRGIGSRSLELMRPYIVTEGKTTLNQKITGRDTEKAEKTN